MARDRDWIEVTLSRKGKGPTRRKVVRAGDTVEMTLSGKGRPGGGHAFENTRHTVVLLPGDSVGPEVAEATVEVVNATGAPIDWEEAPAGRKALEREETALPPATVERAREVGVVLKGRLLAAPGGVENPNVALRRALGLFAQVRPVRGLPVGRHPDVDLVVVREASEGEYAGLDHHVAPGVAQSVKVVTRAACERIAEYAFRWAEEHERERVTVVHKANIVKKADGLFLDCAREAAARHDLEFREVIVDAAAMQLVQEPSRFDVLLTPNFYGDLIADLCAGLAGGISAARAGTFGKEAAVFEAVHGEAPSIVGKGLANPLPLLGSASMMLEHLGEIGPAVRIDRAIDRVLAERAALTPDLGGKGTTASMTQALIDALE